MQVWTIVVAAGSGSRYGEPKQFLRLGRSRVVDRGVDVAARHSAGVVVVLPAGTPWGGGPVAATVAGGATRSASVRAGLEAVPATAEIVVVHDAARPLASSALFDAVIGAVVAGAGAAVPGIPVTDTLKRIEGDRVVTTVPREGLVAVQTPQAFRADLLRVAHARGGDTTDDASLVEAAGGTVVVVPGDPRNIKVTTPADLAMATALLEEQIAGSER